MTRTMSLMFNAMANHDAKIFVLCARETDFRDFVNYLKSEPSLWGFDGQVNPIKRIVKMEGGATVKFVTTNSNMDCNLRGHEADFVFTNDQKVVGTETLASMTCVTGGPTVLGRLF